MPLTNKYLKYTPEITLEIFTLVWNKLIDSGWKEFSDKTIEESYNQFKYAYKYLLDKKDKIFNTYAFKYSQKQTETTVQEILGYDPFVKEIFVLPEKWKYQFKNQEDLLLVGKFITDDLNNAINYCNSDIGGWVSYPKYGWGEMKDAIEITFDQFKKYVLKKSIEEKEVIPEYVEFLSDRFSNFTKGKIYKLDSNGNCQMDNGKFITGSMYWLKDSSYMKPSTKKAFDEQNQPKSIEKWSAGSYVVALCAKLKSHSTINITKGKVYKLTGSGLNFNDDINTWICALLRDDEDKFKWFATKSEAEEFAKTLIEPIQTLETIECPICDRKSFVEKPKAMPKLIEFPKEGCCKSTNKELIDYFKNKYPNSNANWESKYTIIAWNSNGYWFCIEKSSYKEYTFEQLEEFLPKQPLKQAVYCKTQEEWDFVSEKLGYKIGKTQPLSKTILLIDDEDLLMIDIIKTKTVNLLNLE